MKNKFLTLIFISISTLGFTQVNIPYNSYNLAGSIKSLHFSGSNDFIIIQEEVPGFPTEFDVLLFQISTQKFFNMTRDQKSTIPVAYPNAPTDPTGNHTLIYSYRGNKNGLYIQNIWSGDVRQITDSADPYFVSSWSSDGSKVLFGEEGGLINTANLSFRVFDLTTGTSTRFTLPGNEDRSILRGYSNPTWSSDGNAIYYHTYLKRDGDQIFEYNMKKNEQKRLLKGSFPKVNPVTGEILYIENQSLLSFDIKQNSSRVVYNAKPIFTDESHQISISTDGKYVALSVNFGEFTTGSPRNGIIIINLTTSETNIFEDKSQSFVNPVFVDSKKVVFQSKNFVTRGREKGFRLESKIFGAEVGGKTVQTIFSYD